MLKRSLFLRGSFLEREENGGGGWFVAVWFVWAEIQALRQKWWHEVHDHEVQ